MNLVLVDIYELTFASTGGKQTMGNRAMVFAYIGIPNTTF